MASPSRTKRIAVLTKPNAWHYRDLVRAAGDQIEIFNIEFTELAAEIDAQGEERFGFEADTIIVRTMPPGSLQQIVFRMDLLARLEHCGVKILNPPKSIEAAVDKYLSLSLLAAAGIPVPKTRVAQTIEEAKKHFEQLGSEVVVKPLFGSMGNGIERLQDAANAEAFYESQVEADQVIYQQEFIDHGGFDIRLLVIGDKVLGMKRVNESHWITNISQGGLGEPYSPSDKEVDLAVQSTRAVGAHVGGVDLMYQRQSGDPFVIEVNAVPGWRATANVLGLDIAKLILDEC